MIGGGGGGIWTTELKLILLHDPLFCGVVHKSMLDQTWRSRTQFRKTLKLKKACFIPNDTLLCAHTSQWKVLFVQGNVREDWGISNFFKCVGNLVGQDHIFQK